MEALLTNGYASMSHASEPEKLNATPEARTARGAMVFAAIWLAVAVASPLIVRYAPSADDHAMAAWVTRVEQPRCANAPELVLPCQDRTVAARTAALKSDL